MEENVIQFNDWITIDVDGSVENVIYVNVLCYVLFLESTTCSNKNRKYLDYIHLYDMIIQQIRAIKLLKKKQKLFQQILIKKSNLQNKKFIYFTCLVTNYHCISTYCYLIKYRVKPKPFTPIS